MYIKVIAKTVKEKNFVEKLKFWKNYKSKDAFEDLSGKHAGVCYMKDCYNVVNKEPRKKTLARINQTKIGGHHSVFDHNYLTFEISGISKAMAMLLNNEKWYTTSEKSGRYTKLTMSENEQKLYNKWYQIFFDKITELYGNNNSPFFKGNKIQKLAMENARYLNSIFSRGTTMIYTVSYRQLNYLCGFFENLINNNNPKKFYEKLMPEIKDFYNELIKLPYIDETLKQNGKNRGFTLINTHTKPVEYFGDVFQTTCQFTLPAFGQMHRHRTLWCSLEDLPKNPTFYVPPIIENDKKLKEDWLKDIKSVASSVPQGMLFIGNVAGTLDSFILMLYERKCSFAQLEINNIANEILHKYYNELLKSLHPRAKELELLLNGSRCTFGNYKCTSTCGFSEGINETRKI